MSRTPNGWPRRQGPLPTSLRHADAGSHGHARGSLPCPSERLGQLEGHPVGIAQVDRRDGAGDHRRSPLLGGEATPRNLRAFSRQPNLDPAVEVDVPASPTDEPRAGDVRRELWLRCDQLQQLAERGRAHPCRTVAAAPCSVPALFTWNTSCASLTSTCRLPSSQRATGRCSSRRIQSVSGRRRPTLAVRTQGIASTRSFSFIQFNRKYRTVRSRAQGSSRVPRHRRASCPRCRRARPRNRPGPWPHSSARAPRSATDRGEAGVAEQIAIRPGASSRERPAARRRRGGAQPTGAAADAA